MRIGVERALINGAFVDGDVDVQDGVIAETGIEPGSGDGTAFPGFIDLHTHGFGGVDFARASSRDISAAAVALASTGVTSLQPTVMTMSEAETIAAVRNIDGAGGDGARLLGAHLEGPFLSPQYHGAHDVGLLREPDVDLMAHFLNAGQVARVTIAPELPGALGLVKELVERGIVVSVGHTAASTSQLREAFEAGATAVTHLFNAMAPFSHRQPGMLGSLATRDDIFVEVILDGVHLAAETEILAMTVAGDRLMAVTDAMAGSGLGDGTYSLGNRSVEVRNGEARLSEGTIAGSVLTMDAAFRRLVELGTDLERASRATSSSAATLIGRPELGTLRVGTPADIVVLDSDLTVAATYVRGARVGA